jgi:UDP-N-acetylglucosamine 1-carboxyvinyltransferase
VVTENLFAGRFRYVDELVRLGANITTEGHHAMMRGVEHLEGTTVHGSDIRAAAALIAGRAGRRGETTVDGLDHIDRGYDDFVERLNSLGAHRASREASPAELVDPGPRRLAHRARAAV